MSNFVDMSRDHLVSIVPPIEMTIEFYALIGLGAPLYICMAVKSDDSKVYLEPSEEERTHVLRVFWRKEDIRNYIESVKYNIPGEPDRVVVWEATADDILNLLEKSLKNLVDDIEINVVVTAISDGELCDVDLLWSTNKDKFN